MNRRTNQVALGVIGLACVGVLVVAGPVAAALREVRVGNFYYDDATPGDGTVEIDQGDQLRFTVLDGGPGTPHTVDIDELGIHSGSLASGETYTTPPIDRPGTYLLYCTPHQNRGHQATLIVRSSSTATTSAPTTAPATTSPPATSAPTTSPSGSPTTAPPGASTPGGGSTATTDPDATTADGATEATADQGDPTTGAPTDDATTDTLAPVGRGDADDDVLAAAPVDPDSLQAAIGRPPAQKGPWTRSLRLGLIVFLLMAAAAGAAVLRGRRLAPARD